MPHEATTIERARSALSYLDSGCDRDTWVKYGMCLKHEFGDDGFEVWDSWSSQSDRYRASDAKSTWRSIGADGKRTIASLFHDAKAAGWKDTSTYKKPSKAEIEARNAASAKRAEQAAREEAIQHEAAAKRAQALWDDAKPCETHAYLERKGVRAHGLRVGRWERIDPDTGEVIVVASDALLLPILDRQRKLWGLQAIFTDKNKKKLYLKDCAKSGNFLPIGKPQQHEGKLVFILGEGYATCASIHETTGHMVLCCFDVSNLITVARSLRERMPDAIILFAADNDQWTTDAAGNKVNPGVNKARDGAKAVNGLVAVPPFDHDDPRKPTDFNDLQQISGPEAVRAVIDAALNPPAAEPEPQEAPPWEGEAEAPEPTAPPPDDDDEDERPEQNGHFAILGYNRDTYYIFQHGKRQIADITKGDMGEIGLIELAPLNWWEMHFPGERSKIDTKAAAEFIIRTAEKRGIYDSSRIRGRGAWTDAGRMIYHHGGYLSVDGQPVDITRIESRYVYELDKALPAPADEPLSSEDGEALLDLAKMFRWSKPGSAALLAGWVALAPVCGALRWRPHIWLTGGAGCGKSTILNDYAHHLLGGLDLYAQGSSSEAGIRQTLRADARPVLFDESESNEESDARRIQNVLSLIRQASTESEAQTLKGTAGGSSMSFHIRSMFCLASIQVALKQQADVERLTVLALRGKREETDAADSWQRLKDALYNVQRDETLPARLFRRSIDLLPITLKNIGVFTHAAAKHFGNQRDGDQYGTLLAGAWSLISTKVATAEEAAEMINQYDWSEHRDNAESDEGKRALSALMEAHVRIKGGIEVTVYELICAAFGEPTDIVDLDQNTANALLQRYGMKVKGDRLLLSNNSDELRKLMSGSTFAADYRGVLLRVDGADRNDNKPSKFNGVQTKCISLPIGPIVSDERGGPAF